jgi:putative transposase
MLIGEEKKSFVVEFPLRTTPEQERELSIKMEAARFLYNACLSAALKLHDRMKDSKVRQLARKIRVKKERNRAFMVVEQSFHFDSNTISLVSRDCRNSCWIKDHIGSVEAQTLCKRAFESVQQYCFGKRGRPRFKSQGRLHSVEGHCNRGAIYVRGTDLLWSGLRMPLMPDPVDKHGWQRAALERKTKFCRVVRRKMNGIYRWYGQLIQSGTAPIKSRNTTNSGKVGLDVGPSTVAVVSDTSAAVIQLCSTVNMPWRELRLCARKLDRSMRANNAGNFNLDGTVKSHGRTKWRPSSRYVKLRNHIYEIHRKLVSERKRAHGELCNVILSHGNRIHTELLSYRSLNRSFGKSVQVRGPGMFVSLLVRKAENAGGSVTLIRTKTTKLSQYDHSTGQYVKKPLSQRLHIFGDSKTEPVQRDLYSAFLAKYCSESVLDVRQVEQAWPAAEPLLRRATLRWKESASRGSTADSHGFTRLSRSPVEETPRPRRGLECCNGDRTTRVRESCA